MSTPQARFPIVLSNGPPADGAAPSGRPGLQEVAEAGVTTIRTGRGDWSADRLEPQLAGQRTLLDAAAAHGLSCWLWLGDATNLPAGTSPAEQLLTTIVTALRGHVALGAYKGADEPRDPFHPTRSIPPANLVRGYQRVKALDTEHPLVIVQAPRGTSAGLVPYRPAFDIGGVDIYPVSYPPGVHSDRSNRDVSVVGDVTRWIRQAAGDKPVWVTLQVAWSGVTPTAAHPNTVPRFPTRADERFMAYQAIVAGARGLAFHGGHVTEILSPQDAAAGWNWTFWREALQPVVRELSSTALAPALHAGPSRGNVRSGAAQVELSARETPDFLYVIAVRRGGGTSDVRFFGLPPRHDGTPIRGGEVLFEYVQDPPPPPVDPGRQKFRSVVVGGGSFQDWFAPHDVHVYRFPLR